MNQSTSNLIDGAIATYCHHHISPLLYTLEGNLRGMPGITGHLHTIIVEPLVKVLLNQPRYLSFAVSTRPRIHDEYGLFLVH